MTLERCVRALLVKEPFYGLYLLGLDKRYDDSIKTACVCLSGINVSLLVNKEFWDNQTDEVQMGILKHEVGHLLYNHLFMGKSFKNHKRTNLAMDCEVNSDIPVLCKEPYVFPSRYNLPSNKGTKFYYENLPELDDDGSNNDDNNNAGNQSQSKDGLGGSGSNNQSQTVDDHSMWKDYENMSEAEKKLVENQIKSLAKNTAEQVKKMQGTIPGCFQELIDSLFVIKPEIFNWKSYFKRVIGNLITSELQLTRLRPSRRFPDSKGVKMKTKPHILVGVDTSGSVADEELLDFFSEIYHLWKSGVKVTVAQVDAKIQKIEEYKGKFIRDIQGRGGTVFTELYDYYNNNKKEYSTLVIFTDGYVGLDGLKSRNVVWVITPNGAHQKYPGLTVYMPKQ